MPQEQLEGIANVSYGTVQTLAWDTAADWDAAADEYGVVHELLGSYPGAGTIHMGWPSYDMNGSALHSYYPMHSGYGGGTFTDQSGNGHDMNVIGTTSSAGPHGLTAPLGDGSDDEANAGDVNSVEGVNNLTFATWFYFETTSHTMSMGGKGSAGAEVLNHNLQTDDSVQFQARDSGANYDSIDPTTALSANTWHTSIVVWRSGTMEGYINGVSQGTVSYGSSTVNSNSEPYTLLEKGTNGWNLDGKQALHRAYLRAFDDAEAAAWHDAGTGANGQSYLETATKSFSSPASPDLQNLAYSLNGGGIDLKVIGSPGTASEEVVTQTLGGATSYSLTWASSHTDFRLRPEFTISVVTNDSPEFSGGELIA